MTGRHTRHVVLTVLAIVVLSTASCAPQDPPPQDPPPQESLRYQWWTDFAEEGWAFAQYRLAQEYNFGNDGVPEDHVEAARWYRLAAEQGHRSAQHSLGYMYDIGKGVPQDAAEAVRWYRLAAEQGRPEAQLTLGDMYSGGRGRCGSGRPRWPDSANPVSEDPGTLHHVEVGRG